MVIRNLTIAAAALMALPASSALAQTYAPAYRGPAAHSAPVSPYDDALTTGSITGSDSAGFDRCPGDSAAEGNANQQNRLVKQYGQTSGGPRC